MPLDHQHTLALLSKALVSDNLPGYDIDTLTSEAIHANILKVCSLLTGFVVSLVLATSVASLGDLYVPRITAYVSAIR